MNGRYLFAITTALLLMVPHQPLWADLKEDLGYTLLATELGDGLPTGSGVTVTQVEADTSTGYWMPDTTNTQFSGKTITDKTGDGGVSSHATLVGRYFYGATSSLAPGIADIDVYAVTTTTSNYGWLTVGYLMEWVSIGGNPVQPMYNYSSNQLFSVLAAPGRICNHSWVTSSSSSNGDILRRLDFVTETDEYIQVAAVNNGSTAYPLPSGSFNAITVGRTDGNHPSGTTAVDTVYTEARICPLIVVPLSVTSTATPVVASAAALLIQAGRDTDQGNDPEQTHTTDRGGTVIVNAERAETIKAALLAGAQRLTGNTSADADITDYRGELANRGDNGLDVRFGAGQLNIYNSYQIIVAGEQNSAEDDAGENGGIDRYGFDVDPYFGGLSDSNTTASYRFTAAYRRFYAALVWHLDIDGGAWNSFDSTATTYNLDLALYDTTTGDDRLVADSASTRENTENLWVATVPGRSYRLEVRRADGQTAFLFDYALAWRMDTPPDTDGDGMDDEWEVQCGLDYTSADDGDQDGDADGLTARQEYLLGTGTDASDTDGDGASDGEEVTQGTDPLDPDDFPGSEVPVAVPVVVAAALALLAVGGYYCKKI